MPELPEIEVLRRSLTPHCVGREIAGVEVLETRLRRPINRHTFGPRLQGAKIQDVGRRAKYLLLDLDNQRTLMMHMGMTGQMIWTPDEPAVQPHQHIKFTLDDSSVVTFRDPRRFGLALVLETANLDQAPELRRLGVEPLAEDFSGATLAIRARGRRVGIKQFLMDQAVVVGVGNIYASEALHLAAVHPARSVGRVSASTWDRVAESVAATLRRAIDAGGSTLSDFRDGEGGSGYFQIEHAVYGREGETCRRCGRAIRRVVTGGRSTFYCPGCQR